MSVRLASRIGRVALAALLSLIVLSCGEEQRNALFPPEGYYEPILEIATQPDRTEYAGGLVHEHGGKYAISLVFERPAAIAEGYGFEKLDVTCTFSFEGRTSSLPCGDPLLHFWGDRSGVSIALYSVPEDVPKNVAAELQVGFHSVSALDELVEAHGSASIIVRKWSDL